jgi:hypothetical protein
MSSQKHFPTTWEGGFSVWIGRLHNIEERSVDWHDAEARRSKVQWNSHGELVTPIWSCKVERARLDGHCYRFVSEFPNVFVEMDLYRIKRGRGAWKLPVTSLKQLRRFVVGDQQSSAESTACLFMPCCRPLC